MRIALLSAASSIHTARWVSALAARGHAVALFSMERHSAPAGSISPDVPVYYLRGGYLRATCALKKGLAAFAPQVLNVHYATGYGTLARRSGFAPVLLSVWGSDVYDFPRKSPFHRQIVVRNLRVATAVASTSERMAMRVEELCPQTRPPFITPFGVDTGVFSPADPPRVRDGRLTIGIVKALETKYGVDVLLRAFACVLPQLSDLDVRLEIYGGGSRRQALEQLAVCLGVEKRTRFFGAVPHEQVPEVLRRMDIFCAPSVSDSESFGVSAVEALACGVPVVASAVDGFKEVLRDGETGFLVPPFNAQAMAGRLVRLARDADLRRRMGAAGRADVQERFEWQTCVTRMEQALVSTIRLRAGGETNEAKRGAAG